MKLEILFSTTRRYLINYNSLHSYKKNIYFEEKNTHFWIFQRLKIDLIYNAFINSYRRTTISDCMRGYSQEISWLLTRYDTTYHICVMTRSVCWNVYLYSLSMPSMKVSNLFSNASKRCDRLWSENNTSPFKIGIIDQ